MTPAGLVWSETFLAQDHLFIFFLIKKMYFARFDPICQHVFECKLKFENEN